MTTATPNDPQDSHSAVVLNHDEESPPPSVAATATEKNAPTSSFPRYRSIDALRGLAILFMVVIHFVENLSKRSLNPTFYDAILNGIGYAVAPSFTFLVGLSLHLSWEKQRHFSSLSASDIAVRTIKRGIAIFVTGLIHAFIIWGPYAIFEWDILTLIGTAILFLQGLASLLPRSSLLLVFVATGILLAAPFLREWGNYEEHWENEYYEYEYQFTVRDIFTGFLANGYFPLFPWLVFPLIGMVVGQNLAHAKGWLVPISGLVLIVLGIILTQIKDVADKYANPVTFYPATTAMVLSMQGCVLILFWALLRLLDRQEDASESHAAEKTDTGPTSRDSRHSTLTTRSSTVSDPNFDADKFAATKVWVVLQRYSRFSLTVYVLHLACIMWPLYIAAGVQGRHAYYYYKNALGPPGAFALSAVFLIPCYSLLVWWEKRHDGKYSLEWLLAKVTK